jgi:hypothetical protein
MFRTVSIMPGMENFAPDLTLTSSGSDGSPSLRPIADSSSVQVGRDLLVKTLRG